MALTRDFKTTIRARVERDLYTTANASAFASTSRAKRVETHGHDPAPIITPLDRRKSNLDAPPFPNQAPTMRANVDLAPHPHPTPRIHHPRHRLARRRTWFSHRPREPRRSNPLSTPARRAPGRNRADLHDEP